MCIFIDNRDIVLASAVYFEAQTFCLQSENVTCQVLSETQPKVDDDLRLVIEERFSCEASASGRCRVSMSAHDVKAGKKKPPSLPESESSDIILPHLLQTRGLLFGSYQLISAQCTVAAPVQQSGIWKLFIRVSSGLCNPAHFAN